MNDQRHREQSHKNAHVLQDAILSSELTFNPSCAPFLGNAAGGKKRLASLISPQI